MAQSSKSNPKAIFLTTLQGVTPMDPATRKPLAVNPRIYFGKLLDNLIVLKCTLDNEDDDLDALHGWQLLGIYGDMSKEPSLVKLFPSSLNHKHESSIKGMDVIGVYTRRRQPKTRVVIDENDQELVYQEYSPDTFVFVGFPMGIEIVAKKNTSQASMFCEEDKEACLEVAKQTTPITMNEVRGHKNSIN